MNELRFERIKEILKHISTPTGLTYSGDATLTDEDSDMIIEHIDNLQQRIYKAIEINNRIIEEYKLNYGNEPSKLLCALEIQNKTLQGKEVKNND